jgi:hypothetical protein
MKHLLCAVAGAALLLAAPALAQTLVPPPSAGVIIQHESNAPVPTPGDDTDSSTANNRASRNYDALVGANSGFRNQRMHKECDPIEAMDLRQQCYASFGMNSSTSYGSSGMSDRSGSSQLQPKPLTAPRRNGM